MMGILVSTGSTNRDEDRSERETMSRRHALRFGAGAAALILGGASGAARADEKYPARPVTIVVAAGAGSGPDASARRIAALLSTRLGKPVIVDDRPGAAGIVGTDGVARARPDGYTVLLATNSALCINPALFARLPYDPDAFVPISMTTLGHPFFLIDPKLPFQTLEQWIAHARKHPGELAFASGGVGSTSHLAAEMLKSQAGIDMLHVPYKEESQALSDVISGQVQSTFAFGAVAQAHVKTGRLRALAIAGPRRSPALPEVRTTTEQGLPALVVPGWLGLVAPAGTPAEIVGRLHEAVASSVRSAEYRDWVKALGSEAIGGTPDEFARQIKLDRARWAQVVKAAGVHLD